MDYKGEFRPGMMYGVFDTADSLWLGDDSGPKFEEYMICRVAAQVYEMQVLGTDLAGRFEAREFVPGRLHKKDELPTKMGTLQALKRIGG